MSFEKEFPIPNGNRDSWSSMTHGMSIPQESGIGCGGGIELVGYGDPTMAPRRPMPMDNGTLSNMDSWNTTTKSTILQRNGISQSSSSWLPVTSEQQINEKINPVPVEMQETQLETENWHDLIGMYTDLLQEKPVNQQPPPMVHNNGNQNWVASITKTNLTQTPNPVPYQNHTTYQPSIYNTSLTSMLGSQQTHRFTSTNVINNGPGPKDGFTVNYGPHYCPGSPPRLKPDHIIDSFPFAPITPGNQIKQMNGNLVQEKVNILNKESSARAETENANDAVSMKDAENLYNELLQTIENSPPSAVSTTQKDCIVSEDKDEQASDLQKTPNQKTPSRRRKHRPKVIREGKPKRTPKNPKTGTPGEIRVKRKYVRRKGVNNPNENTPVETVQKRKYVRRKGVNGEKTPAERVQKRKYVRKKGIDHSESQPQSTVDDTPPKSCKKQLNFDLENMTQDKGNNNKSSQPDITVPSTPHVKPSNHGLNGLTKNMATSLKQEGVVNEHGTTVVGDTPPKSCKKQLSYDLENMTQDEGHGNITSQPNIIVPSTPLLKASCHALNVLARNMATSLKQDGVVNENGIKNDVFQTDMRLIPAQHTLPTFKSEGMVSLDERRGIKRQSCEQMNYNANAMNSLLMYQKMLLGVANRAYNSNHLGTILLENRKKMKMQSEFLDNSRQMQGVYGNRSAMGLLNSSTGRIDPSCKVINIGGNGGSHRFWRPMSATHYLLKRQLSNGLPPHMMRSMPGRLQNHSRGIMISWNKPSLIPTKAAFRNAATTYPKFGPNSYNQRFNGLREMLQQHRNNSLKSYQKPSKAARGRPRKQKVEDPVDIITRGLERLQMYDGNRVQQNELVLYKGSEAMIPFVPIKKRNQRPKVDLDPESERLWNLLMGNEESNGAEKQDDDKEKWWENERRVFSGRTDSFIARMHLVQGDRRFSRWKGSVVDSVIGVFLTQNVSDHLSSSAFMSLAAKFPVKSTSANETCCQDGIPSCHEKTTPSSNSPENTTHIISSPRDAENIHFKISEEEVIPSQESFDSSTIQTVDECGSSAGSNSEDHSFNDDQATNMHHSPEEPACNIQVPETNGINLNSPSSQFQAGITSGLPSSNSGVTDAYHTSNVASPQSEIPKFQTPPQGQYNLPRSHPSQPSDTTMLGGIPIISVEDRVSVANKQNCFEDTVTEANSKKQDASRAPTSGPGSTVPKAKKETPDERKTTIDWDSLRKQALSNSEKKERSKDAYDTIDYEALRQASVDEISNVIKERGMNNLLADRMKDFLNRLVTDHGSVDLEWLRDAPPDKAKDYLLSFRGLGLKSVECIRLLTLHHLAFPVDTNVGRIAVRLGWVPLQPLPESLQLHLLEMYPVLESIQKYLWPRLCKLDQLTLYELHYQMITFGKVFCTKSKPNCNACPMRAECRHFASAFASARLALPGPEEKRIVPSDAPVTTDPMPPPVVIRPMPLPPAENESNESAEISGNTCEPIIEEPTTPEPETNDISISDIEDQYYEDSDEIPSIKLNMEEFTTNLQNIMQDSNDLSKALVALTPKAASIPTPKLKDVSRLRTEHLVYELPDSHQLLEGLDKREPDDPSPYLLAIWTPGETANSAQAPTTDCLAQKSGQLCDQTTCFSCNSVKEANSKVVRGTILIPCRTAMRGSFPLNGTYFQVNEMFADHASSLNPIDVPRTWIWNLPRRKVYFGTSVSTIFKGLTTEGIQYCFWKGFVCVRGFDRINRAPRPLMARLHFPASKLIAQKTKANK